MTGTVSRLAALLAALFILLSFSACRGEQGAVPSATTGEAFSGAEQESAHESAQTTTGETASLEEEFSPLLWRVKDKNGHEMLLFGTIHVGDERSLAVLEQVRPFLEECAALAVEFDVTEYEQDLQAQIKTLARFVYTDGTTIRDHISEKLYENMVKLLNYGGIYNPAYESYNTAFWLNLATQALINRCTLSSDYMMDRLLIEKMKEQGKEVRSVESADMQMELLAGASEEYNVLAMTQTLRQAKNYNASLSMMYEAWLSGNEEILAAAVAPGEDPSFTKEENEILLDFAKKMTTERNIGMAEKAEAWLKNGDKVFFAVGTAHFVGEGGVIDLLQKKGCTVDRIKL